MSANELLLEAVMSKKDKSRLIAFLVASGADPNHRLARGRTPIFCCENVKSMEKLLELGADPNLQDDQGLTPLMWILTVHTTHSPRRMPLARMLCARGARIDLQDKVGNAAPKYFTESTLREVGYSF